MTPVCHSQAASVHLVPLGDEVVLATQGFEVEVALARPDGTPVGEGATPACSEGLVTMGAFGLLAAHRNCSGNFVLDLWTSSLGKAREIKLPEGVHVAGIIGDRLYGGTDDGRAWSAQLEGGVVTPRLVDAMTAPISDWRRAPDGTEWILSGKRLLRTRAGSTVAISTPLPAFALWAPRADEVWIAVVQDDHSRALLRGHY